MPQSFNFIIAIHYRNISVCQLCATEIPLYFLLKVLNKHHHNTGMHWIHVKLAVIYDLPCVYQHSTKWQCNLYLYRSPKHTSFNLFKCKLVLSISWLKNNFLGKLQWHFCGSRQYRFSTKCTETKAQHYSIFKSDTSKLMLMDGFFVF